MSKLDLKKEIDALVSRKLERYRELARVWSQNNGSITSGVTPVEVIIDLLNRLEIAERALKEINSRWDYWGMDRPQSPVELVIIARKALEKLRE